MTDKKTHYRKVFKSDHLGVADLEDLLETGADLIFTITHVNQEFGTKVAGRNIDANIAYFKEKIKPLVLNSTNSKTMKGLSGGSSFVEDWVNIRVQLYIDPSAKLKGEVVGGVRINPNSPVAQRKALPASGQAFDNAVAALKRDGNLDKVLARVDVTDEVAELIRQAAK